MQVLCKERIDFHIYQNKTKYIPDVSEKKKIEFISEFQQKQLVIAAVIITTGTINNINKVEIR